MRRGLQRIKGARHRLAATCFSLLISSFWIADLPQAASVDASASGIRFKNVAAAAGLEHVLRNDARGRKYQPETLPAGAAVIDIDNDGWQDLYFVNGASLPSLQKSDSRFYNRLYRNNRDGTFTDVTERAGVAGRGYSMAASVADYDNDGWEDIYVSGVNDNILYRNNGDGTFTDVTRSAGVGGHDGAGKKLWAVSAAWLDYDNDGRLDLFVSNYCDWRPELEPVCGERTYCHPDAYRGQPALLYHNNGDGTFRDVSLAAGIGKTLTKGMGLAIADYDDDGYMDVFQANDNARNLLFHNRRDGTFEEVGIPSGVAYNDDGRSISGMGTDFRDYDGDGLPDIVMTGLKRETYELFRNIGKGQFADASRSSGLLPLSQRWNGWGCGLIDFDNDARLDLFVAAGGLDADEPQPNRIFRGVAAGRFADVSDEAGPDMQRAELHRGTAFADFDNDGRMDAAVTALNGRVQLLMNESPRRHWIGFKLKGTTSNRSGIGAKISCRAAHSRQVSWVTGSVGYASSGDLRPHFGLHDDSVVQEIQIHWPSGTVQLLSDIKADQMLEVVEPKRNANP